MNDYTEDLLHLVTRERHEQRRREGDAERLARELRGTPRRRRLRLTVKLGLCAGHRVRTRGLEA